MLVLFIELKAKVVNRMRNFTMAKNATCQENILLWVVRDVLGSAVSESML